MCNIAGYVGTKRAAPILFDLIKKQEGIAGGYYTGIATVHEGKIYSAKLTGDVETLLKNTNAYELPGTIGIIHSRSKAGGGDEWAHPFIAGERLAYVANGTVGCFKNLKDRHTALAQALFDEGYQMTSRVRIENDYYQHLNDGTCVHMSDVMANLIVKYESMEEAFCKMPGEIVGLAIEKENENAVSFARVNYPMSVAFADHGAYLSSMALVFPKDAGKPQLLAACSSGKVFKDRFETNEFKNPPVKVAAVTKEIHDKAYKAVYEALLEGDKRYADLPRLVRPYFPEGECNPCTALVYEILNEVKEKLHIQTIRVPGAFEGMTAPEFRMSIQ